MYISFKDIKCSRKKHICNYCDHQIPVGSSYSRNTYTDMGSVHHAKMCGICSAFLKEYPEQAGECSASDVPFTYSDYYDEVAADFILLTE